MFNSTDSLRVFRCVLDEPINFTIRWFTKNTTEDIKGKKVEL